MLVLSGSGRAAGILSDASLAVRQLGRRAYEALQAVCCGCLDSLIGSSAVQVSAVVRSAYHLFATRCFLMIELVARRPSTAC